MLGTIVYQKITHKRQCGMYSEIALHRDEIHAIVAQNIQRS